MKEISVILLLLCMTNFEILTNAEDDDGCNDGWKRCLSSNECFPTVCEGVNSTVRDCGNGQTYCEELGSCVPLCQMKTSALRDQNFLATIQQALECRGELIYCLSAKECRPTSDCTEIQEVQSKFSCANVQYYCYWTEQCEYEQCGPAPHQTSCPIGKVYCLVSRKCETNCASLMAVRQQSAGGNNQQHLQQFCDQGQIYCTTSGRCVSEDVDCTTRQDSNSKHQRSHRCRYGLIYCVSAARCVEEERNCAPSQDSSSKPQSYRCGYDMMIYCASSGRCVAEEGDCTSNRDSNSEQRSNRCGFGMIYCASSGRCVPEEIDCPTRQDPQNSEKSLRCREGQIYCMSAERCVSSPSDCPDNRQGMTLNDLFRQNPPKHCLYGMVYCISTGMCTEEENCQAAKNQFKPSPSLRRCERGMIFCLQSQTCTYENQCGQDEDDSNQGQQGENVHRCRNGEVFCWNFERCLPEDVCSSNSNNNNRPDEEYTRVGTICRNDEVYCLASGSCEQLDNCKQRRDDNNWGTICQRGYIYCLENKECVSITKGCSGDGGYILCPENAPYCIEKGMCSADCKPDSGLSVLESPFPCPSNSNFNYTSCLTEYHCPFNYKCCYDRHTSHAQCIDKDGNVPSDQENSVGCSALTSSEDKMVMSDTKINCDSNESCEPGTICCVGKCRNNNGACPPMTSLMCSMTKRCTMLLDKCMERHKSGTVLCTSTSNTIVNPKSCDVGTMMTSPLTLCGPKIINKGASSAKHDINDDCKIDALHPEVKTTEYIVLELSLLKRFQLLRNEKWIYLEVGMTFKSSEILDYDSTDDPYEFGVSYIIAKETNSDISRKIVQLLVIEPSGFDISSNYVDTSREMIEEDADKQNKDNINLSQLITIEKLDDTKYWEAKQKAHASGLVNSANDKGLLDSNSKYVKQFIEHLWIPDLGLEEDESILLSEGQSMKGASFKSKQKKCSSRIYRGISMKIEGAGKLVDSVKLYTPSWNKNLVRRGGFKGTVLASTASNLGNVMLLITTTPFESGEFELLLKTTLMTECLDYKFSNSKSVSVKFKVNPINNQPFLKSRASTDAPYMTFGETSKVLEFIAGDLAKLLFADPDSKVGLVVLCAQPDAGKWSYRQTDGGYKEIDDLNDCDDLAEWEFSGSNIGVLTDRSKMQKKYRVDSKTKVPIISCKEVEAVAIPGNRMIRYVPDKPNEIPTIQDSLKNAKFVFRASGLDSDTVQFHNLTFGNCKKQGKYSSFSNELAMFVVEFRGCYGDKNIDGEVTKIDKCGECGGDDQTCTDCQLIINGKNKLSCARCIGENEENAACDGSCEVEDMIVDDKLVCRTKSEIEAPQEEDKCEIEGKRKNRCNECVGPDPNTGQFDLAALDFINKCGSCDKEKPTSCLGCDGEPNSKKINDTCGDCVLPNDPEAYKCEGIYDLYPTLIDLTAEEAIKITIKYAAIDTKTFSAITCKLISATQGVADVEMEIAEVTRKYITITASSSAPSPGKCRIKCTFRPGENEIAAQVLKEATTVEILSIVNSADVKVISVQKRKKDDNSNLVIEQCDTIYILRLTLDKPYDLSNVVGIMIKKDDSKLKHVLPCTVSHSSQSNKVECIINCRLECGLYELRLALSRSLVPNFEEYYSKLDKVDVEVKPSKPEFGSATLSPLKDKLVITFNRRIQMIPKDADCLAIFDDISIFGEDPKCVLEKNSLKLEIKGTNLEDGSKITVENSKLIQYKCDTDAPQFNGTISITHKVDEDSMEFSLSGVTTACNNTEIHIFPVKRGIPENVKITWDVKWAGETSQNDVNQIVWKSLNSIREVLQTEIPEEESKYFKGDLMVPDVIYQVIANIEDDRVPENKQMSSIDISKVEDGDTLQVTIHSTVNGKLNANGINKFRIRVNPCEKDLDVKNWKYFLSLKGDIRKDKKDKQASKPLKRDIIISGKEVVTATVPKGTLKSCQTYKLSVRVMDVSISAQNSGLAKLEFKTKCIKIKPEIHPKYSRISLTSTPIIELDASGSRDLEGEMNYIWQIRTADMKSVIIKQDGKDKNIANAVPKEDLRKDKLELDAAQYKLSPGQYKVIATMTNSKNNDRKAKAVATVDLVADNIPIVTIPQMPGDGIVEANADLRLKAIVTASEPAEVTFASVQGSDPNSEMIDGLENERYEIKKADKKPYYLVIDKSKLEDGKAYIVEVTVKQTRNQKSTVGQFSFTTSSPPICDSHKLDPLVGYAFTTKFQMEIKDCKSENQPITIHFGFKEKGREFWIDAQTGSSANFSKRFVAKDVSEEMTLITKECDNQETCSGNREYIVTINEDINEVTTQMINDYSKNSISDMEDVDKASASLRDLGKLLDYMASKGLGTEEMIDSIEDATLNIVAIILRLCETIQKYGPDFLASILMNIQGNSKFTLVTLYAAEELIVGLTAHCDDEGCPQQETQASPRASSRRQGQEAPSSSNVVFPDSNKDLRELRNFAASKYKKKIKTFASEKMKAMARSKRSVNRYDEIYSNMLHKRFKRKAGATTTIKPAQPSPIIPRKAADAENLITTQMLIILNGGSTTEIEKAKENLIQKLPGILGSLCLGISEKVGKVEKLYLSNVALKVEYIEGAKPPPETYSLGNATASDSDFLKEESSVDYGPILDVLDPYFECSDDKEEPRCYGYCLASYTLSNLFQYPLADNKPLPSLLDKSRMIEIIILNPKKGTIHRPTARQGNPIKFSMAVEEKTNKDNDTELKCYGWGDGKQDWDPEVCKNDPEREVGENQVACNCDVPGKLMVYEVEKSTKISAASDSKNPDNQNTANRPTNDNPSSDDETNTNGNEPNRKLISDAVLKFKIDFEKATREGSKFKEKATGAIVDIFEIAVEAIITDMREGSTDVQFDVFLAAAALGLKNNSPAQTLTSAQAYQFLMQQVNDGKLIVNIDNAAYRAHAVTSSGDVAILPILIGGIVSGVLLVVVIIIIFALTVHKRKGKNDKVMPITGPPTYPNIYFEQSLDGTTEAIRKKKESFNYSKDHETARYEGGGLIIDRRSATSRTDSGIGDDVPAPAVYNCPSKEELQNSGPIPEHILARINQERLPGSLE